MPTYETLFITPPNLPEDEERTAVDAFALVVADGGGQMVTNDRMGRRRLAYPIRKFDDGVYVRFLYDAEPPVSRELDRRIRLSDKVLRSLTVRLEPKWAVDAKDEARRAAEQRVLDAEAAALAAAAGETGAAAETGASPTTTDSADGNDRPSGRVSGEDGENG
jgi:small subunit ribosomal protein S6